MAVLHTDPKTISIVWVSANQVRFDAREPAHGVPLKARVQQIHPLRQP